MAKKAPSGERRYDSPSITVRFDSGLYDAVSLVASAKGVSLAAIVRRAVKGGLECAAEADYSQDYEKRA